MKNSGSEVTKQVNCTGNYLYLFIFIFNFFLKKRLKDELTGNTNQLFPISTEDSDRENEAKLLWVKMKLDTTENMVVKHWNEVSEQVVGLTPPTPQSLQREKGKIFI